MNDKFYKRATNYFEKRVKNKLFDDVIVEGKENIPGGHNLYVSNHLSLADFLVQGAFFGKEGITPPRFIAGRNLNHFPFGYIWKKAGAISIDRNNRKPSYWKAYIKQLEHLVDTKQDILIYPEGGRSYDGKTKSELKTGSLKKIIQFSDGNINIVPMFITYDNRIEEGNLNKVKHYKNSEAENLKIAHHLKQEGFPFYALCYNLFAKADGKKYFYYGLESYLKRPKEKNKGNAILRIGEPFLPAEDFESQIKLAWKFLERKNA
jgi:1-acyl-sn-glycerol-3-phosphate acyltransferase